jgi:hypothetical protein
MDVQQPVSTRIGRLSVRGTGCGPTAVLWQRLFVDSRTVRIARSAARGTAGGATIACLVAGTAVPAGAAQGAGKCAAATRLGTVSCVYADPAFTDYVLVVPAGVDDVYIEARGAAGGDGGTINPLKPAARGGPGGLVAADFPVTPGDLLHISVGGHGRNAQGMKPGAGGGNGGAGGGPGAPGGGGGGGASGVRLRGSDNASRILVAGGGGGAGGAMNSTGVPSAGGGGGAGRAMTLTAVSLARGGGGGGVRGENGSGDYVGEGGMGAVGPSGGAGLQRVTGRNGQSGYDEQFGGAGGEGGYGTTNSLTHSGVWAAPVGAGGGGGGYAGGSGGAAGASLGGGGGGGSGFVATSALAPSVARLGSARLSSGQGSRDDGLVVITYRLPTDGLGSSQVEAAPNRAAAATPGRSVIQPVEFGDLSAR